jgi:hypothetical protein
MEDLKQAKELLDEINAALISYDPVLKEKARDLLLDRAFGRARAGRPAGGVAAAAPQEADTGAAAEVPRRRPGRPKGSTNRRKGMQLPALLQQWSPETMAERALLGAYSLSRGKPDKTVTSQSINSELKSAGIPVPNITRAIESNLRAKPPLMTQKKKLGTTRQARKQYAITQEGVEFVENRIQSGGAGEPGEPQAGEAQAAAA